MFPQRVERIAKIWNIEAVSDFDDFPVECKPSGTAAINSKPGIITKCNPFILARSAGSKCIVVRQHVICCSRISTAIQVMGISFRQRSGFQYRLGCRRQRSSHMTSRGRDLYFCCTRLSIAKVRGGVGIKFTCKFRQAIINSSIIISTVFRIKSIKTSTFPTIVICNTNTRSRRRFLLGHPISRRLRVAVGSISSWWRWLLTSPISACIPPFIVFIVVFLRTGLFIRSSNGLGLDRVVLDYPTMKCPPRTPPFLVFAFRIATARAKIGIGLGHLGYGIPALMRKGVGGWCWRG